jgi:hypothetical protein
MQADPWQNNHEPYHAYHEWFFARQVVLDQINKANDYIGPSVDDVWIGLGGYWWQPNANGSYYTDCCHISGSGATFYRQKWIEGLLKYNPVVSAWLLADPPVAVNDANPSMVPVSKFQTRVNSSGAVVSFSLAEAANISMGLYTVNGRAVVPMSEKSCNTGYNSISLTPGNSLSPGAYIIRLNDGSGVQSMPLAVTH